MIILFKLSLALACNAIVLVFVCLFFYKLVSILDQLHVPEDQAITGELFHREKEEEINQTELSRRTGVPQPTISRILDALHESPNFQSMLKLAKYFKVPVETLYEEDLSYYDQPTQTMTVDSSKTITIEIKVH